MESMVLQVRVQRIAVAALGRILSGPIEADSRDSCVRAELARARQMKTMHIDKIALFPFPTPPDADRSVSV
jgi:hypothetical protein